jgi:hypothetical protein
MTRCSGRERGRFGWREEGGGRTATAVSGSGPWNWACARDEKRLLRLQRCRPLAQPLDLNLASIALAGSAPMSVACSATAMSCSIKALQAQS